MSSGLSLRERVALAALRGVNTASRLLRRGSGTVAGGRVGLRLAPTLLASLARGRTIVVVSGTNGKTTTTALCVAGWGGEVTTNRTGANMPAGHVAALAASDNERVVLEVDEAWLADVIAATRPRVAVLLNLSRDQLDRANEVRRLAERWRQCLADPANAELTVVANANDPLVVYAALEAGDVRWCDVPTGWTWMPVPAPGARWPCSTVRASGNARAAWPNRPRRPRSRERTSASTKSACRSPWPSPASSTARTPPWPPRRSSRWAWRSTSR
ncbi:MAG: Mur ligase family protein [Acidimicrobiales bacterium]